jgi:predicted  nucleic acid-binding Zn-ribbon protein
LQVKSSLNEHVKLLKQAETTTVILQKRIDELNIEVQSSNNDVKRLQTELIQSKQTADDQQSKIESLTKENRKLSGK